MQTATDTPSRDDCRRCGWALFGLQSVVVALLAFYVYLAQCRLFDPDEFEHLHACVCMQRGDLPYRDFFEHHGPLYYLITWPVDRLVIAFDGLSPRLLLWHRLVSIVFVIGTLPAVYLLAAPRAGPAAAWGGLAVLLASPWFSEKAIEGRPDVPATFFVAWAALLLCRSLADRSEVSDGPGSPNAQEGRGADAHRILRCFGSGLLVGLASLATLKIGSLAVGLAIGWSVVGRWIRWKRLFVAAAAGLAGVAVIWLLAVASFATLGAARDFFESTVVLPLTWEIKEGVREPITRYGGASWFCAAWMIVGLAVGWLSWLDWPAAGRGPSVRDGTGRMIAGASKQWRTAPLLPAACAATAVLAAAPFVSATYLQYYLPSLPLMAALGAVAWRKSSATMLGLALLLTALPSVRLVSTAVSIGIGEALTSGESAPLPAAAPGLAVLTAIVMLAVVSRLTSRARGKVAWLKPAMASILLAPSVVWLLMVGRFWKADGQWADLRTVAAAAPYDQRVLDGFTGFGCCHRHACRFWWLNEHSIPLMLRTVGLETLAKELRAEPPSLIILDVELQKLGHEFWQPLLVDYDRLPVRLRSVGAAELHRRKSCDAAPSH